MNLQFYALGIINTANLSLFTYNEDKSWADYYDPSFSPVFEPTFSDPDLEEDAREICDGDTFCLFDIAATKSVAIGMSTMQGNQDLERITELSLPGECVGSASHISFTSYILYHVHMWVSTYYIIISY